VEVATDLFSDEAKNEWSTTFPPATCLRGVEGENVMFAFTV